MKTLLKISSSVLLLLLLVSCSDILEKDISNYTIQTIFPSQGEKVLGETVNFQWREIEDVDSYRIQVSSASRGLIIDSLTSSDRLLFNMKPGDYEWRIRGENNAYSTTFNFPVDFTVEKSDDLTSQTVILTSPSVNYYTNNKSLLYIWEGLDAASSYDFELVKSLNGNETVFIQNDITATNLTVDEIYYSEDAKYIWRVRAVNGQSVSDYNESNFYIDTFDPNPPSLNLPEDQEIFGSSTISFSWDIGNDLGNVPSDRSSIFQLADDMNFTNVIHEENVLIQSTDISLVDTGTFYWRVKVKDEAGNVGNFSSIRSFTLN